MQTVFDLCKLLIIKKKTAGLQDKLDAFLAVDRLTIDEYNTLVDMLNAATTE